MRQTIRDLCECSSSSGIAKPNLRARVNKLHTWLEEGVVIYLNRHGGTSRVTLNLQLKRSCQGSCYQHKNRINTCKSFDPCRPAFLWANLFPFVRSVKVKYISFWANDLGVCSRDERADSTNAILPISFKLSQFMRVIWSTKTSQMIGSTKTMALVCKRISSLNYSKLPRQISFFS